VWIPKYRKPIMVEEIKQRLELIFKEIAQERGLEILAMEIMPDHLHIFVSAPPKQSPSLIVNWLKGISARLYNHRFKPKIKWARAYYVGTAGTVTSETIRKYIEEQSCKSKK
jgi:putative transposase